MRLLLDTHAFLWWIADDPRLTSDARDAIADPDNEVLLSAASGWEIAIKVALGRQDLPVAPSEFVPDQLQQNDIGILPIGLSHALGVFSLPHHNGDPLDRMLISQAGSERMTIITGDPAFQSCQVDLVW